MQLWMACRARQSNNAKDIDQARRNNQCLVDLKSRRTSINVHAAKVQQLYTRLLTNTGSEDDFISSYQTLFAQYHHL
jgi:hypothetical protein